jgi:RNase P subunit RPR2
MVMGELKNHYVEILLNKNKFDITCSCGWKNRFDTRRIAFGMAHLHVAKVQSEQ